MAVPGESTPGQKKPHVQPECPCPAVRQTGTDMANQLVCSEIPAMLHETLAAPSYLILIFWDGRSRGTKHMIDACQVRGATYSVVRSRKAG